MARRREAEEAGSPVNGRLRSDDRPDIALDAGTLANLEAHLALGAVNTVARGMVVAAGASLNPGGAAARGGDAVPCWIPAPSRRKAHPLFGLEPDSDKSFRQMTDRGLVRVKPRPDRGRYAIDVQHVDPETHRRAWEVARRLGLID